MFAINFNVYTNWIVKRFPDLPISKLEFQKNFFSRKCILHFQYYMVMVDQREALTFRKSFYFSFIF